MATLAADKPRSYEMGIAPIYNDVPVIAADIIYEGAAVGEVLTTGIGNVRPLVATDIFIGFADAQSDNSLGAAAAKNVRVRSKGAVQLAVAGTEPAVNFLGTAVYASDDDTFTFTAAGNTQIGKLHRKISAGVYIVLFEGVTVRSV